MSDNFKLNIDIPQADIKSMAKQIIREIIEEKIQLAMEDIDINKIINGKLNDVDSKITKVIKDSTKKQVEDLIWKTKGDIKQILRDTILEEIQKKPLSGNIYLKIDNSNVSTDYDEYNRY